MKAEILEVDISKSGQIQPKILARPATTGHQMFSCSLGELIFSYVEQNVDDYATLNDRFERLLLCVRDLYADVFNEIVSLCFLSSKAGDALYLTCCQQIPW